MKVLFSLCSSTFLGSITLFSTRNQQTCVCEAAYIINVSETLPYPFEFFVFTPFKTLSCKDGWLKDQVTASIIVRIANCGQEEEGVMVKPKRLLTPFRDKGVS